MENVKARLAKGALWLVAARAIVSLIGLVSIIALARLLSPADFGLVAIGTALLAVVSAVTTLSLSTALIHLDKPTDEHLHTAFTLNVLRSLLVSGLFAASAIPVSRLYNDPRLSWVICALAATILITGFSNPRVAMLAKGLVFWQEFVLATLSKFGGFIAAVFIAYWYQSYWALVVGSAVSQLITTTASYLVVSYRPRLMLSRTRELWSFSMWLTLCEILNTLNFRADQLMMGGVLSKEAVGFYTVGGDLAALPTREITTPLTQTIFPGLVAVASSRERLLEAVRSSQTLVFGMALPFGFGFALLAEPLVDLVLGPKWQPAVIVIQCMAAFYAMNTITVVAQPLAMALGETKLLFIRDLFIFGTRMPLVVAGLLLGGFHGAVYARVLAGAIHIVIHLTFIRRIIGLTISAQVRSVWRSLASLSVMIGVVWLAKHALHIDRTAGVPALASAIAAGGAAYSAAHALLWFAAGRPDGPERKLIEIVGSMTGRLRSA